MVDYYRQANEIDQSMIRDHIRKHLRPFLFTNELLDTRQGLKKKKLDEHVQFARGRCEKGLAIDIGKVALTTSLNLLSNTFFSQDFSSYDSSVLEELKDLAWRTLEEDARPNVPDCSPLLRPLDLQGTGAKDDILDTLLKRVEEKELTLDDVKHLLVVLSCNELFLIWIYVGDGNTKLKLILINERSRRKFH
ncbi:hypothetical protein Cgig2_013165 [Carnegiea gigantea]|uniref:Uncharacterized protein n=1 Tax=Carnegiea gigantea TaxID=171969 RepID=A0A9Q1QLQ8_9CARY|nr:hypothetical protein Cgig2_013165 [Carnegiea gigantea]